jgi:pantothenate synthetase
MEFKLKSVRRDKGGHIRLIKRAIHHEEIIIVNLFVLSRGVDPDSLNIYYWK